MKTGRNIAWMLGVALGALPFVSGCMQQNAGASQANAVPARVTSQPGTNVLAGQSGQTDQAASMETQLVALADTNAPANEPGQNEKVELAVNPGGERPLPTDIFFSPALRDVIKMAEAGIEESILLSYISNSASTFNLGAEQIIYLNDIGISDSVVLAMIEQDRRLGVGGGQAVVGQAQSGQAETAAAPAAPARATEQYTVTNIVHEPTVVNYNYFYESLAPYGSWITIDGYGLCWRPTVVVIDAGWHPYCHRGRWVYSNWGWYWQSDYTWGSIVFHYGRWFRHPRWGWCWWPDTVWAPAWVVWRHTDYYCGWAPLPPFTGYSTVWGMTYCGVGVGIDFDFGLRVDHYTYVPWHRFGRHRPDRHRVPRDQIRQVHERAVVVNDFVYGDRHAVSNRGIPFEHVARRAGHEIPRVTVRDLPGNAPRNRVVDKPHREGNQLVVYRHPIPGRRPSDRAAERPTAGVERPGLRTDFTPGERIANPSQEMKPGRTRPESGVTRVHSQRTPRTDGARPRGEISTGQKLVGPTERPGTAMRPPTIQQERTVNRPESGPGRTEPGARTQPSTFGPGRATGAQPARPQPSPNLTKPAQPDSGHRPSGPVHGAIQRPAIRASGSSDATPTAPQIRSDPAQSLGTTRSVISQPMVPRQSVQSQPVRRGESSQGFVRPSTPARTEAPVRVTSPPANVVVQRPAPAQPASVPRVSAPVVSAPPQPDQRHVSAPSPAHANQPSAPPPAPAPRSADGSDRGGAPARTHKVR